MIEKREARRFEKEKTFKRANVDTPPATRKVHIYSGNVYLIP